jgi:hypothetical protein
MPHADRPPPEGQELEGPQGRDRRCKFQRRANEAKSKLHQAQAGDERLLHHRWHTVWQRADPPRESRNPWTQSRRCCMTQAVRRLGPLDGSMDKGSSTPLAACSITADGIGCAIGAQDGTLLLDRAPIRLSGGAPPLGSILSSSPRPFPARGVSACGRHLHRAIRPNGMAEPQIWGARLGLA